MACSDVPSFRAELLRSCAQLSSPECQSGISQAVEAYGDQCLLLPLYATVATAPVAAYVCPKATGALAARCEAVAPGLVGPAPGGSAPGAEQQGPSTGRIVGGSVVGVGALGGALEYWGRRTPYFEQIPLPGENVPDDVTERARETHDGGFLKDAQGRDELVFTSKGIAHRVIVHEPVTVLGREVRPLRYTLEKHGFNPYRKFEDRDGTVYLPMHQHVRESDPVKAPGFFRRGLKGTFAKNHERKTWLKQAHKSRTPKEDVMGPLPH